MAGPWEQYQAQQTPDAPQDGPWSQYAAPQAQPARSPQPQPRPTQALAPAPGLQGQMEAAGLPPAEAEYFARNDAFEGGLGAPGESDRNPIDISTMNPDALVGLPAGTWVMGAEGPYQLTESPAYGTPRPGDEQAASRTFVRPQAETSPGYQAAVERERSLYGEGPTRRQITFTSQATAPINDEMDWLAGYGSQGFSNLIRRLRGQDIEIGALDAANAARDVSNEMQSAYEDENPLRAATGNILGGFALAPARAASLAGAVPQFIRPTGRQAAAELGVVGAGYGAAEASGGVGDRALGAAGGAALAYGTAGALMGGERAAAGLLGAGRGIVDRVTGQGVRMSSPDRRVARVLERDITRDGQTVEGLLSREASDAMPFELAGDNLELLAEAAVQSPGSARQRVGRAVMDRQASAPARIRENIEEGLGGDGGYFARLDELQEGRREAANAVMEEIGQESVQMTEDAVQALRSERARNAIRQRAQNALSSMDPVERASGASLNRLADEVLDNPGAVTLTVRDAQDISRALNEAASSAYASGDGGTGQAYRTLGRSIRDAAREGNPRYREFLTRYGDDSDNIAALELGRNVFSGRMDMSAEAVSRQLSDMGEVARENFQRGVGEAMLDRARQRGVPALRQLVRNQEFTDRVKLAFPDEPAFNRFMDGIEQEVLRDNRAGRILQNSRTAVRGAKQSELEGDSIGEGIGAAMDVGTGNVLGLLNRGGRLVDRAVRRNRGILSNEATNERLGEALADPEVFDQLLRDLLRSREGREQAARLVRPLGLLSAPGSASAGGQEAYGLIAR